MESQLNPESSKKKIKLDFKESKYATGRRKKSIARVWLKKGNGSIYINGKTLTDYFKKANLQIAVNRPLNVSKRENEIDVRCTVKGGGLTGQAGAILHGLARALVKADDTLKPSLKKAGFLTRDSRMVERQKYGRKGARARYQFSKR